jgi:hypothetical protein
MDSTNNIGNRVLVEGIDGKSECAGEIGKCLSDRLDGAASEMAVFLGKFCIRLTRSVFELSTIVGERRDSVRKT